MKVYGFDVLQTTNIFKNGSENYSGKLSNGSAVRIRPASKIFIFSLISFYSLSSFKAKSNKKSNIEK